MSLSQRERWIVIVTLIVVGLFFGDRWVFSPVWDRYTQDTDRAAELQERVFKTQGLLQRRQKIQSLWDAREKAGLTGDVSRAEGALLNRIEHWAGGAGLAVTSMKPEREQARKSDTLSKVRCRLSMVGGMEAVTRFCFDVETSDFPVMLESVQMSSSDPKKDAVTVQFVLTTVCLVPTDQSSGKVASTGSR
ncbi:MAG: hypothetical protein GC164_14280 [Phycisphaera sp.]|nr:hypothetical protein [Phycisphaera sp.]